MSILQQRKHTVLEVRKVSNNLTTNHGTNFSIYPNYAQTSKHFYFSDTKCKHVFIARSAKKLELYLAGNYFILAVANN